MKLHTIILFSFCLITNSYLHGADAGKNDTPQKNSDIDIKIAKRQQHIQNKIIRIQRIEAGKIVLKTVYDILIQSIHDERRAAIKAGDDACRNQGIPIKVGADYVRKARNKHSKEISEAKANYNRDYTISQSRISKADREINRHTRRIKEAQPTAPVAAKSQK